MKSINNNVRTRFAPSPTGDLHIGGVRTAIFSWLVAKHFHGEFLLRIEDTDKQREKPGATQEIIAALQWLGLDWDGPILYQSQRLGIYKKYLEFLKEKEMVYCCNCSSERLEKLREMQLAKGQKPKYDGHCRHLYHKFNESDTEVIRFKTPLEGTSSFQDLIRGEIRVENKELDDLVIWRSTQCPTYNFCVVIDDWLSEITHVVRGEDHINNTHRQNHIARALGAPEMQYAHVPMILGEDGKKLSKRFQASGVMRYKEEGFLPEAVLNYLVRLGWSHGNQEIFSKKELIEHFCLTNVKSSPAAINPKKLQWLNRKYIQSLSSEDALTTALAPTFLERTQSLKSRPAKLPTQFKAALALYRSRAHSLEELNELLFSFFYPSYQEDAVEFLRKNHAMFSHAFINFQSSLERLPEWTLIEISKQITQLIEAIGDESMVRKTLRLILSGKSSAPAVDALFIALGKEESLFRLSHFLNQTLCH